MSSARFFMHRGLAQMRIETPADLDRIPELEAARWSATSVPNEQLFCDPAFLAAVDTDKNGRVRRHEVLTALAWLRLRLADRSRMFAKSGPPSDGVRLADLDVTHADVVHILQLAKQRLGKGSAAEDTVTLAEIRGFADSYKKKHPNGDGVMPPSQCLTPELAAWCKNAVATVGGALDVSGELGIDDEHLDELLARAAASRAWRAARSWDDETDQAIDDVLTAQPKLEQFFAQCDLVGQEANAAERMAASAEKLESLDVADTAAVRAFLERAPLSRPTAAAVLDATGWLNPLYAAELQALFSRALPIVLAHPASEAREPIARLSRADWEKAKATIAPMRAHKEKRPAPLPKELDDASAEDESVRALRRLIEEDRTSSAELASLADLERIALLQRWLVELLNNMVSFPGLFRAHGRCLFEAGTLILDGRELTFCVRAPDIAAHKPVAERSNMFVVYVELTRKDGDKTLTQQIAATVTSGHKRGIGIGKRGVFYDRDGKEHDARVVDVIERPISLLEATIAPFVRVKDAVLGFIEKTTAGKLSALETKASAPDVVAVAPAAAAPAETMSSGITGKLMGGGIAIAALGSGAAFTLQTLAGIRLLDAVAAVASVCGAIALLAGFLGWLKLRRRDLSTVLEACGWAFNVRIYLNRRHALRFTRVPPLPNDSDRTTVLLPAVAAEDDDGSSAGVLVFALFGALLAAAVAFREPLFKLFQ